MGGWAGGRRTLDLLHELDREEEDTRAIVANHGLSEAVGGVWGSGLWGSGWVGGWWIEENEAVQMRCCGLHMGGWVGGWVYRADLEAWDTHHIGVERLGVFRTQSLIRGSATRTDDGHGHEELAALFGEVGEWVSG